MPDFTLFGCQTRTFAVRFFAFYGFYLNSARRFGALVATSLQIYLVDSHVFCFTGKSKNFSRSKLANKIEAHNGIFKNNISSKTNYLVLGLDGSETWSYSTYGRKVEKALEIQKQGNSLLIIQENDLIPLFN